MVYDNRPLGRCTGSTQCSRYRIIVKCPTIFLPPLNLPTGFSINLYIYIYIYIYIYYIHTHTYIYIYIYIYSFLGAISSDMIWQPIYVIRRPVLSLSLSLSKTVVVAQFDAAQSLSTSRLLVYNLPSHHLPFNLVFSSRVQKNELVA